ncbi:MAG: enoyl-CoA hydratase/isomerase family protein [Gammaproteobacteria bacterium]
MAWETITYEVRDRTALITLNRPEMLNAISDTMIRELPEAYARAEADPEVWTLMVTGAGRGFCSGADLSGSENATASDIESTPGLKWSFPGDGYLEKFRGWEAPQEATRDYLHQAKPMIAVINGVCAGAGMDFVTTSDIVVASDKASFLDPHVGIGIVSGREMVRLARVLPLNIAMRLALMGKQERMSAERAYQLGLVSEVIPHGTLMQRAWEIAGMLNANAPLAVRGTRLAIRKSLSLPINEAELLAEQYRIRVAATEDAVEGPKAFMEKRPPRWKGR